jgi:phosphatidate cytidylyltransferase
VTSPDEKAKWASWSLRVKTTLFMIAGFLVIIYLGHWALVAAVIAMSVLGFSEIEALMRAKAHSEELPVGSRALTWYWFALTSFVMHGRILILEYGDRLVPPVRLGGLLAWLPLVPRYHTFIAFCGFVLGFVAFVLLLKPSMYKVQFKQLAWTWMALFLVVSQASFWAANTLDGLIWIMFPASLVICNDCMAYVFGFFFGRTPLIALSPKKTWEGFIGGGVSTLVWATIFSTTLARFDSIVCEREDPWSWPTTCARNPVYDVQQMLLPADVSSALAIFGVQLTTVAVRPIVLHALVFACFAAVIAPFGGFFASGFKRAFKLKDFADTIPGHGGILDRMDCQFIMGTWTAIYVRSFISPRYTVAYLAMLVSQLPVLEQIELRNLLTKALEAKTA